MMTEQKKRVEWQKLTAAQIQALLKRAEEYGLTRSMLTAIAVVNAGDMMDHDQSATWKDRVSEDDSKSDILHRVWIFLQACEELGIEGRCTSLTADQQSALSKEYGIFHRKFLSVLRERSDLLRTCTSQDQDTCDDPEMFLDIWVSVLISYEMVHPRRGGESWGWYNHPLSHSSVVDRSAGSILAFQLLLPATVRRSQPSWTCVSIDSPDSYEWQTHKPVHALATALTIDRLRRLKKRGWLSTMNEEVATPRYDFGVDAYLADVPVNGFQVRVEVPAPKGGREWLINHMLASTKETTATECWRRFAPRIWKVICENRKLRRLGIALGIPMDFAALCESVVPDGVSTLRALAEAVSDPSTLAIARPTDDQILDGLASCNQVATGVLRGLLTECGYSYGDFVDQIPARREELQQAARLAREAEQAALEAELKLRAEAAAAKFAAENADLATRLNAGISALKTQFPQVGLTWPILDAEIVSRMRPQGISQYGEVIPVGSGFSLVSSVAPNGGRAGTKVAQAFSLTGFDGLQFVFEGRYTQLPQLVLAIKRVS